MRPSSGNWRGYARLLSDKCPTHPHLEKKQDRVDGEDLCMGSRSHVCDEVGWSDLRGGNGGLVAGGGLIWEEAMGGCDESYMCKIATMALASATISHEIGHHSACFLPQEVGIHKFGSTYVRSKDRKKHETMGFCVSFAACESKRATLSVSFPRRGIVGGVVYWDCISYYSCR